MIKGEGKLFTTTVCDSDDDWLQARKGGIGGSDVAAIMGFSPWKAPVEVWMEKTNRIDSPDLSDKESVRMGIELESVVLDMYKRRHPESKVQRVNAILTSVERPWAQASLDAIVCDPDLGWGVLEIKTGSKESEWKDGVPIHYQTQVGHYLSVTGYDFADVAALIGDYGLHYHEYRIMRDAEDIAAIDEDVDSFWNESVKNDTIPPNISNLESEGKALSELYKNSDGEMTIEESERTEELARRYAKIGAIEKEAKEEKQGISNELKRLIGEHKGIMGDEFIVTHVRTSRGGYVKVRER